MEGQVVGRTMSNGDHLFITKVSMLQRRISSIEGWAWSSVILDVAILHSFIYEMSWWVDDLYLIWFLCQWQIFLQVSNLLPNTTIINFIFSYLIKDFVSTIIQSLSYFSNSPSLENHILANKRLFHALFYSNPLTSTSPSSWSPLSLPFFI